MLFVAKTGDLQLLQELDKELNNPPDELTAVLDPTSFLLVVFGGLALLNVVGNISYLDGKFGYNPEKEKDVNKQNINGVVRVLKAIIPFGANKNSDSS